MTLTPDERKRFSEWLIEEAEKRSEQASSLSMQGHSWLPNQIRKLVKAQRLVAQDLRKEERWMT